MTRIGAAKPRKQSLISNLLNRVDNLSLAVKSHKDGIMVYWVTKQEKHIKCNKEVLAFLSYEQVEQVMEMNELYIEGQKLNFFKLDTHFPEKVVEHKQKKGSQVVRSFKQTDKIGTDKGQKEIFSKKPKHKG